MTKLTVNTFNDLDSSINFADELRRYKDPSNIRDSVNITEAISQNKTTQDLVDSVNFADDLRKLKTPSDIESAVDRVLNSDGRILLSDFGVTEQTSAEFNALALRTALDLGAVKAGVGTFKLSRFEFKSGDDLEGSGYETHFESDNSMTFIFGALSGNSFLEGVTPYKDIQTVQIGDNQVTLTTPSEGSYFSVGDLLVIHSSTGYTDSLGDFKPAFQQITKITGITNGVISIAEGAYKDAPPIGVMRISKGEDVKGYGGANNAMTENVRLSNLSVSSSNDSWMRLGGTYRSSIKDLYVRKSKGAFVANGFAYCDVHIINAKVSRYAVDCAFFNHNNLIKIDNVLDSVDDPDHQSGFFTFAELCHDNTISVKSAISVNPTSRATVILFARGSQNNKFLPESVFVSNAKRLIRAVAEEPSLGIVTGGNFVGQGTIKVRDSNQLIQAEAFSSGDSAGITLAKGLLLESSNNTNAQILTNASDVNLSGVIFNGAGKIEVNENCANIDLSNAKFLVPPDIYQFNYRADIKTDGVQIGKKGSISSADKVIDRGSIVTSETFAPIYQAQFNSGVLLDGDAIEFEVFGRTFGNAAEKSLELRVNDTPYLTITDPAEVEDVFSFTIVFQIIAPLSQRIIARGFGGGGLALYKEDAAIDISQLIKMELGGFVSSNAGGDGIFIEYIRAKSFRKFKREV